ncbi:EamA family transporter [Metabacillus sp. FJAT-53654]|uniref:EamA family transporter n=1 Tax=Metabacillus rhizosphaerae TaxID=3117747 RepID=A0ABZ2MMI2_9BACI
MIASYITVSILGYFEPLSALDFSASILGEKLSLVQIAGALLILGGAAFGELLRSKKNELREEKGKVVL